MRAIQDELGDRAKKETDVEVLRKKILAAKMPKSMEEKVLDELERYNATPSNSAESGVIRTYLDFVVSLPWSVESVDSNDIKAAKERLDADHYGLEKVKDRILEYLAVKIKTQHNPQTILCLVGPPGVGKTSLAKSIAAALNKKFVKQSLGGIKDESEIRGHRRTYLGALPGRILQGMKRAGTVNPVFLLDEIDKMSSDYKGDPASAMLEVLDSEQNKFFSDNYLEEPYDLSKVFFIATANYLGNIPEPLRDRLEIVEVSSYTEYEKFEIAKRHLIKKQLGIHGLSENDFSISDEALLDIIRDYTREAGVRELERHIGSLIRKAIKNILMNDLKHVDITRENLEEYLGKKRFTHNVAEETDQIGVVTGLAYTQYGGDTLAVEVTYYKGNGALVLTGKLGDVMKESAQAALSYVKANAERFNIPIEKFKENDIHIHVPEGAIPKDGPSAGVTICTAIISALSGKPVNHNVGMTGEITLRGRVLPIGGLREKSIAANRSGLGTIIIPADNMRDLDEVPQSVKDSLNIIPVSSLEEVLKYAFK
jgi:ATP-dependent Lon protease